MENRERNEMFARTTKHGRYLHRTGNRKVKELLKVGNINPEQTDTVRIKKYFIETSEKEIRIR